MSRLTRIFKGQHYIVDNDKRMIHKLSKITIHCDIGDNVEYLTDLQANNYEVYDYYLDCPYCCRNQVRNHN